MFESDEGPGWDEEQATAGGTPKKEPGGQLQAERVAARGASQQHTHSAFSAVTANPHPLFFYFFFYICPWKSCICTVHQAQLQDAKRRWEELQSYLHSVNTEREKLQAAKQGRWCRAVLLCFTHIRKHIHGSYQYHSLSELQSQLLAVETEMNNKNKEIQTLHSSLTDTMVSKEQVEQKVMQLLEVSQHNLQPDNSLQAQVQVPCVLFFS